MKKQFIYCILACISGTLSAQKVKQQVYGLKEFSAYFNKQWINDTAKSEGMGMGTRQYEFILDTACLQVFNKAGNPSKDKKKMECYHQDMGIYSFDSNRKRIVYREFTSEKFYSQYVLDSISPDKSVFVFHSELFENVPPGYKGRITLTIHTDRAFTELFELAAPGKEFSTYVKAYWERK